MRKWARSAKDTQAEMGVGTLIIFIAMVLVAAVAASVLINVVDNLQEQATQVADDTQDYFSKRLSLIDDPVAVDTDDDGTYDKLIMYVQVSYFSGPVDTTGILVIVNGQNQYYNSYLEETGEVTEDEDLNRYLYDFYWNNPSDLAYDNGDIYLEEGQTAMIILGDANIGFEQDPGEEITISISIGDGLSTGPITYTAPN